MYSFEIYYGKKIEPHIQIVAQMRIKEFANYPYLYDGNMDYEKEYLTYYTKNEHSMLILVKEKNKVIACATSTPLSVFIDFFGDSRNSFERASKNIDQFYYYGEIIILPQYRNLGLGNQIYNKRLEYAKSLAYKNVAIITVVRPSDHKLKPNNYIETYGLFEKQGFKPNGITCENSYLTFVECGVSKEKLNLMKYWEKEL